MKRSKLALVLAAAASTGATFAGEPRASACGGCFHPPPPPTQTASDITDERMLLSVSGTQSTLYDQIRYSGSPSTFAWVLPIRGTVTVGLSADILFDSIDELTATKIVAPPMNCPVQQNCSFNGGSNSSSGGSGSSGGGAAGVTVLAAANVGPYETVQLQSTSSTAIDDWLTQNGYDISPAVQPILDAYVQEGFDFLAMKLQPNQGVQAMRPVRVTTPGASLSLPLRMASVGTGAITGITIWVVADGRYEPQNFPFFHIDDSQLVWDWAASISNYTTLRVQNEANLKNAGWEIESSLDINKQLVTSVILSGGVYYGNGIMGGSSGAVSAGQDYLPIGDPDAGAEGGAGGYESAEQVRDDDINALFAGLTGSTARITRIRSDIAQKAMTTDFQLQAAVDQSELSNVRNVTQSVNLVCPPVYPCQGGSGSSTGSGSSGGTSSGSASGGTSASSGSSGGNGGSSAGGVNGAMSSGGAGAGRGGGGSGGCIASPQGGAESGAGFAATAAALVLATGRMMRVRRRSRSGR